MIQDIKYGIRLLARNPVSTLVAVLTLTIGIGVNIAVFSMVNAVLLRALPFRDAERLMLLQQTNPKVSRFPVSYLDYVDWKKTLTTFEGMGAYTLRSKDSVVLVNNGNPVQIQVSLISHDLFPVMGIAPQHGRGFAQSEESPGQDQVIILSHRLWNQHFGSSTSVIGKQVEIAGKLFTVVGVMGQREQFPEEADAWMPLSRLDQDEVMSRGDRRLLVIGRLKPGISEKQSLTELESVMHRLADSYPEADKDVGAMQVSLISHSTGNAKTILMILLGAGTFVLLIACTNLTSLLLSQAVAREKEIAVRAALGGTRTRIIRQMLAESLLLALIGTTCGIWVAMTLSRLLKNWFAMQTVIPRLNEANIDWMVLAYALGLTLFTSLAMGVWPALKCSRTDLNDTLRDTGKGTHGSMRKGVRNVLIAIEVAVAIIVMVSTTLLVTSFRELTKVDPGFRTANVLTVKLALPLERYQRGRQRQQFYEQLLQNIRTLPGVKGASTINILHIVPSMSIMHFAVEGAQPGFVGQHPVGQVRTVSPGYFEMMGIAVQRGRTFSEADTLESAPRGFVVNETLAHKYFAGVDPIGRGIIVVEAPTPYTIPIIGVVADVRDLGLDREPEPEIYGVGFPSNAVLLVHTLSEPTSFANSVGAAVRSVDPLQPLGTIMTMNEVVAMSLARRSLLTNLMASFAGLALLLAVIGIYGLTAYAVTQRTAEIGIRMAVGADRKAVLILLLKEGLFPVAVGSCVGLIGAWSFRGIISGFVYGISPLDLSSYIAATACTIVTAGFAILVAAGRAITIDPKAALARA